MGRQAIMNKINLLFAALHYDYADKKLGRSYEQINIMNSLQDIPWINLLYLPTDKLVQNGGKQELSRVLRNFVNDNIIDYYLEIPFRDGYSPYGQDLKYLQDEGIPTIEFDCDSSWRFDGFIKDRIQHYDYFITTHSKAVDWYKQAGGNVIKSQWGGSTFFENMNVPKKYDVTFIGMKHSNRGGIIQSIKNSGVNIQTFGRGWPNGKVSYEELNKIMCESKICLNLSNASTGILSQIKGRHFEIPLFGSLQLTDQCDNIQDYFIPDKEIVIYTDKQDMLEKIKYYLEHDQEREEIALAGYNKCTQEHMWENRFKEIFNQI